MIETYFARIRHPSKRVGHGRVEYFHTDCILPHEGVLILEVVQIGLVAVHEA